MTSSDQNPSPAEQARLKAHERLLVKLWAVWVEHRELNKDPDTRMDPVVFSRVSVVTLTQVAAVTAVDVGMGEDQFLNTCKANYKEAEKRAPRWK